MLIAAPATYGPNLGSVRIAVVPSDLEQELGHDEIARFLNTNLNEEGGQHQAQHGGAAQGVKPRLRTQLD